jgi:hypothetical protein
VAIQRAGIIRLARTNLSERATQFRDKQVTLRPTACQDQHLGSVAVERCVVDQLRRDVSRLKPKFTCRIKERHHDHGAYVSQLGSDGFTKDRIVSSSSFIVIGSRWSPHDRVVRTLRSGHVHVTHRFVSSQIRAHVAIAAHDPDKPLVHERREHVVQDGR